MLIDHDSPIDLYRSEKSNHYILQIKDKNNPNNVYVINLNPEEFKSLAEQVEYYRNED